MQISWFAVMAVLFTAVAAKSTATTTTSTATTSAKESSRSCKMIWPEYNEVLMTRNVFNKEEEEGNG
ncbi:hypothetical protein RU639_004843 [Aspergillus parasiticus]